MVPISTCSAASHLPAPMAAAASRTALTPKPPLFSYQASAGRRAVQAEGADAGDQQHQQAQNGNDQRLDLDVGKHVVNSLSERQKRLALAAAEKLGQARVEIVGVLELEVGHVAQVAEVLEQR